LYGDYWQGVEKPVQRGNGHCSKAVMAATVRWTAFSMIALPFWAPALSGKPTPVAEVPDPARFPGVLRD
jgi:hypothetical protein